MAWSPEQHLDVMQDALGINEEDTKARSVRWLYIAGKMRKRMTQKRRGGEELERRDREERNPVKRKEETETTTCVRQQSPHHNESHTSSQLQSEQGATHLDGDRLSPIYDALHSYLRHPVCGPGR